MNLVILTGRLTKDPQITYFEQNGEQKPIAQYTLAVDRKFKKQGEQTADFVKCKAFGKNADFANNYLTQGVKLNIQGHVTTGSYTNKDGAKVYYQEITVDFQEFCESKKNATSGNTYPSDDLPPTGDYETSNQPAPPTAPANDFMKIPDDIQTELPFR